jgi:hypothetical protein
MTSPVTLAEDGAIMWRGFFKSPEDAARLAEQFEAVKEDDWFFQQAQYYANALRMAIQEQAFDYAD